MDLTEYSEKWKRDPQYNFAVACYNNNSMLKLKQLLRQNTANTIDMRIWKLRDPQEFFDAVAAALNKRQNISQKQESIWDNLFSVTIGAKKK